MGNRCLGFPKGVGTAGDGNTPSKGTPYLRRPKEAGHFFRRGGIALARKVSGKCRCSAASVKQGRVRINLWG